MLPLFADEPTRALVAIEMMFSDNYLVYDLWLSSWTDRTLKALLTKGI